VKPSSFLMLGEHNEHSAEDSAEEEDHSVEEHHSSSAEHSHSENADSDAIQFRPKESFMGEGAEENCGCEEKKEEPAPCAEEKPCEEKKEDCEEEKP